MNRCFNFILLKLQIIVFGINLSSEQFFNCLGHLAPVSEDATLCYAMLRYATLCYAMLRYATLCYAMLRYATLCYAMLRYATLR
jgi:uncharacterized protein YjbI with pentapeptide repeats